MVKMHVTEITIAWPNQDLAKRGNQAIMDSFCGYKKPKRPEPHIVDLAITKYVIPIPDQEHKIMNKAVDYGGEAIDQVSVPRPPKISRGSGYAETVPTKYDAEHFLAAVSAVLNDPNSFPDSMYSYDGDMIRMSSMRYKNFLHHGTKCVTCGIEGKFFLKQKSHADESHYHMNLYALKYDGTRVLMTRDHIMPRSKGGSNNLENLQTMCGPCNWKKADSLPENFVPGTI